MFLTHAVAFTGNLRERFVLPAINACSSAWS